MPDRANQTNLDVFDKVYAEPDADEIVTIEMTRRQWWHLDDWRAEHPDRYPNRARERQAALAAIEAAAGPVLDENEGKDAGWWAELAEHWKVQHDVKVDAVHALELEVVDLKAELAEATAHVQALVAYNLGSTKERAARAWLEDRSSAV